MGFKRVVPLLRHVAPTLALVATAVLLGLLLPVPGLFATKLLLILLAGALAWSVWSRGQRTARLIARFVKAMAQGDFQQGFRIGGAGPGLAQLGQALDDAAQRLRAERASGAAERRFAAALADEAPTPLLAIAPTGTVHLANKAARRLFQENDGRPAAAFARYGSGFADALATIAPGRRLEARVRWNGLDQRAVLAAATAERDRQPWRIVSVNIIQRELDAAELAVQADLVRVLTHEIMNSLTPVTSLAASAAELVAKAEEGADGALADARMAIETLARRATGVSRFVESYREFGRSPSVTKAAFAAQPWVDDLLRIFAATPAAAGVRMEASVEPARMRIDGDAGLLGQVVLNLLKNGAEAAAQAGGDPAVTLALRENDAGRVRLSISDTGPGVPASLRDEIFLPFFTTKRTGTGVGLSFARQVVLLHGGLIGVAPTEGAGATFEIVF